MGNNVTCIIAQNAFSHAHGGGGGEEEKGQAIHSLYRWQKQWQLGCVTRPIITKTCYGERGARWWRDDRNYYLAVQRTNLLLCVPLMCRKVIQQPSFVLQYPHQPFIYTRHNLTTPSLL